ncbi:MAG: MBL fold metallo-hydrolase, partial [Endomicrobiia bacterium]
MTKETKKEELQRRLFVKQLEEKFYSGEKYIFFDKQILWILLFVSLAIFFAVRGKIVRNYFDEQINIISEKVLKITFFDVRQGDSAMVTFPSGKSLLIDAGAAKGMVVEESDPGNLMMEFDAGKKVLIPYIQKNNINLEGIIITHHHSDHFGGVLSLLEGGVSPRWIMDNGVQAYHPEFFRLLVLMKEKKVEYRQSKLGKLNLDPEVDVEILAPMTQYSLTEVGR